MLSLIRRIFGKRDDSYLPAGWEKWDGPWFVFCAAPYARRLEGSQFVVDDPQAEHDQVHYIVRGMTALHLLNGKDHLLASHELAETLTRCCPDGLDLVPAEIMDVPTGKLLSGYVELRLREQITREETLTLKPASPRVWRYDTNGGLFVSTPVVRAIQEGGIRGLQFWPGVSSFIGEMR